MEQEDLETQSFAIISQLLEFWQLYYFVSKEELQQIQQKWTKSDTTKPVSEEVVVNEIPNVALKKQGPKLKYGTQIPAHLKPNGSWNFYTIRKDVQPNTIIYQTIFSLPTKEHPVPATASCWFRVQKGIRWNVYYRFEHHNQTHLLSFGEMVPFTGFTIREEQEIKEQASLVAKPLRRLLEIIEAKSISVQ